MVSGETSIAFPTGSIPPIVPRVRHAMPGADVRSAKTGRHLSIYNTETKEMSFLLQVSTSLRSPYAISGTDRAYGAVGCGSVVMFSCVLCGIGLAFLCNVLCGTEVAFRGTAER